MGVIDLRSDTVTLPSPEMRRAMFEAEVGDDVYGEDATINALQERAAGLLGKEAGLYVTSGTMGNLTSILAWCRGGDEVICGESAHILNSEQANAARVAQVQLRSVPQHRASLDVDAVRDTIRGDDPHWPRTGLICVEQSCKGWTMSLNELKAISDLAHSYGIPVHMDGARIFNAAIALGVEAREIAQYADSVTFCVSKGLAAPVGSVICGSQEFIGRAYRGRKMIGGAMRQAGIIAAGGLYALEHNIERLAEDHANAQRLAAGLRRLPGITVDRENVETNMFYIDLSSPAPNASELSARLREHQVLTSPDKYGDPQMRLVTHYGIEQADVDRAIDAFAVALGAQQVVAATA